MIGLGSNHGRTSRIGWPGLNATDGGGGTRRDSSPAAGDRRRKPKSTLRVSIRRGLVSRMDYASCVVHLGPWRASGRSVAVRARTAAALHGGSRRRAANRVLPRVFWPAVWSRRTSVTRVSCWSTQGGGSMLRRGSPWREAALGRRRAAFSRSRSRSGSVLATRSVNGVWVIYSSA